MIIMSGQNPPMELADIIDIPSIQSMMNDFYEFARIPMAILDNKSNILVGVGLQDICMEYHRSNPQICQFCMENNLALTDGISAGKCKMYKCKNNMWDVVTPIIIGGRHLGSVFLGQFFFDDEKINYEFFRAQARENGFDEKKYIAALEAVPRLSKKTINYGMSYLVKLANLFSKLGYNNVTMGIQIEKSKRLSDIGTLAATVAHELRNPLAAMSLATVNVRRKSKDPSLEKHLSVIEKKITESEQIINNLLFYSRIKSLSYEKVNLLELLDECINVTRKNSNKNIHINESFEADSISLEADPFQVKEMFSNILNNAHDAVSNDTGKIEVTAYDKGGLVHIQFKDNGVGIESYDLPRIFEPFFTTKAKGTGLGLSVCNQIATLHNGSIKVESEYGRGTTISVTLPKNRSNGVSAY